MKPISIINQGNTTQPLQGIYQPKYIILTQLTQVESKLIYSSKRQIPSGVIHITSERALLPGV
jgi:hypothetical protein